MKVKYYNPVDEKGGCIVRSISKALNKEYNEVKEELISFAKEKDYHEEEIFEKYLIKNKFLIDESKKETLLINNDLKGVNLVLAYHDNWYHMVCVVDNIIYDKNSYEELKSLKVIKIYKLN